MADLIYSLNNHYTYFLILAASLAGPLLFSFDKKVAFYKKWKYCFPAMVVPAFFYLVWDAWFTKTGVWSFNPAYITGTTWWELPVEEVLFFFVIPYCSVFIYECVRSYFRNIENSIFLFNMVGVASLAFAIGGIVFYEKQYTCLTFIFNALFLGLLYFFRRQLKYFNIAAFIISSLIISIPFLIINGLLTSIPVVLYNDAEITGLHVYTIPVEDFFYGMLLVMMNVLIYEKLKHRVNKSQVLT